MQHAVSHAVNAEDWLVGCRVVRREGEAPSFSEADHYDWIPTTNTTGQFDSGQLSTEAWYEDCRASSSHLLEKGLVQNPHR